MNVLDDEISSKRIGESTVKAIKDIQKKSKLPVNGKLNDETLKVLNTELFDVHHTRNKTRTEKLHTLLDKLELPVEANEKRGRIVGDATRKAIESFQKKSGLTVDGKISEAVLDKLHEEVIKKTYSTKTQIGKLQATILRAAKIAKLPVEISATELKNKTLEATTSNAIKALQEKYKLPQTGKLDKTTLDKIRSIAVSRGTRKILLKKPEVRTLATVTKTLRLNMVSPKVAEMQKALSFLGYKISENEFKTQTFGKTTIKALRALQKEKGIAQTGHYDKATSRVVNSLVASANPGAIPEHRYRIRGSVRNELWQRKNDMVIKIFEKILDKESAEPLAAKKNFLNGFFDLAYDAPIDPVNGQIKEKFHLVIKLYNANDQQNPVAVQTHYNVNRIHWVNFTESKNAEGAIEYKGSYAGESDFEVTGSILQKAIGNAKIEDLKETASDKQISQLSLQTGLSTDDIMCHVLSHLVANAVNVKATLNAEVFYAFIRQNLPADLPGDLLREPANGKPLLNLQN